MGYKKANRCIQVFENYSSWNPNDSTTYLLSNCRQSTSYVVGRVMIPFNATVRRVDIAWNSTTQDSTAEDTEFYIRLNNATDYAVYTGSFANANSPQHAINVNCPITAGDFISLKMVTPAWVTNPTGVYFCASAELSC